MKVTPLTHRDQESGQMGVLCGACGGQMGARYGVRLADGSTWLWWACEEKPEHATDALPLPQFPTTDARGTVPGVMRNDRGDLGRDQRVRPAPGRAPLHR